MSALFTSAGTSRARTAVKDRRRVLARASMMASNRLCPSCHGAHWSPGLGLGGAAPPETKAALQLDWRPRRGGSHQRGPLWAHLHCRDQACATWRWCTVHSARAHFTATAAGKTGSSLCETSNQPLGLPRPSSGISIASPSSKDQRAAFSKRPKKATWTHTEVNCGRK